MLEHEIVKKKGPVSKTISNKMNNN
jgi:hypothetical protein